MSDMNTFEQQLASGLDQLAGQRRPVDAMGISRAVITQSPKWRFQSMFSATKFVVAGAIVALFGGFLLSGVLTQEGEEAVPAAVVSASPTSQAEPTTVPTRAPETTVTTDLLPGVSLVTEELEPGVFRVLNDGIRNLAYDVADYDGIGRHGGRIVVGLDGSVWSFPRPRFDTTGGCVAGCTFYRLGETKAHLWSVTVDLGRPFVRSYDNLEVATDGTVWALSNGLSSFDGETWTVRRGAAEGIRRVLRVEATDDGAVWALWFNQNEGRTILGRLAADAHEWKVRRELPSKLDLIANPAGTLVLADTGGSYRKLSGTVEGYKIGPVVGAPKARLGYRKPSDDTWIGDDGTLWVLRKTERGFSIARGNLDNPGSWDVFDLPAGPQEGFKRSLVGVAPDGAAWLANNKGPRGLSRFDGSAWTHYLPGEIPISIDFAADGTVWLQAWPDEALIESIDTYVITPEAVPATE